MATRGEVTKHKSVFIVVAIMAVAGIVLFSGEFVPSNFSGAVIGGDWFDVNWQYRIPVSFTQIAPINNFGIAEVTLVTQDSNLNNDCSDIRVTDAQHQEVNYGVASCTPTSAKVRFEYPVGSTDYNYYIYYGNVDTVTPPTALTLWRQRASPLTLRGEAPSSTTKAGRIYLTGGSKAATAFEVYTPTGDTWVQLPNVPQNIGAGSATVALSAVNVIRVVGGSQNVAGTRGYDSGAGQWMPPIGQALNFPRSYFAAVIEGNEKIHVFGGRSEDLQFTTNTHEILWGVIYSDMFQWANAPVMPTARSSMGAASVGDKIYVIGGQTQLGGTFYASNKNEVFDVATQTWTTKASMPTATRAVAVASTNNIIYAIGGLPNQRGLQIYDVATDSWTNGEALPGDKRAATATAVAGKIYVMGGLGDEAGMYEYIIPNWGLTIPASFTEETFPTPEVDADGDGVVDGSDLCPNTPAGQSVTAQGCADSQIDDDGDTYKKDVDCNDDNIAINPGATEICGDTIDQDCSGADLVCIPGDDDTDGVVNSNDVCPNTPEGQSVDATGCADSQIDIDADGYFKNVDCNDYNVAINPGAAEVCDQIDNNCNTQTDEGDVCAGTLDEDTDGVVNANDLCPSTPAGQSVDTDGCANSQIDIDTDGYFKNVDCNDNNAIINPGAAEACDQIDNNCNTQTDEGDVCSGTLDDDSDGVVNSNDLCADTPAGQTVNSNGCANSQIDVDVDGYSAYVDCNDNNFAVNPGATEICTDTIDNNCNNLVDIADPICEDVGAQADADEDGVADVSDLCLSTPAGQSVDATGCANSQIDVDADGFSKDDDCNDNNGAIHTSATEICEDGVDNDCNGLSDLDDPICAPSGGGGGGSQQQSSDDSGSGGSGGSGGGGGGGFDDGKPITQPVKPKTPVAPGFFDDKRATQTTAKETGGFDLAAGIIVVILAGVITTIGYLKYFKPELAKKLLGKLGGNFKPAVKTGGNNNVNSNKPSNIFKG